MTDSAEGFVLREIRYGDTGSIVKIYTRNKGLRSFIVKGLRPSGGARGRSKGRSSGKAGLFPLLKIEFTYMERRESQTLYNLQNFRPSGPFRTLYGDVRKVCMLTFVAELLSKCLPEGQGDEALYDYIGYFLTRLDAAENQYGHYHVWFLLMLSRYLGCCPQVPEVPPEASRLFFDLQEGRFGYTGAGGGDVTGPEAQVQPRTQALSSGGGAAALYRLLCEPDQAENTLCSMRNAERQGVLHLLLQYYTVQFSLPEIKSYAVLREIFQVV